MSDLFGTDVVREAHKILTDAIDEYQPTAVFAGFSGGHDSLCATHVTAGHLDFSGCLHINTGFGIQRTRQFVRETCLQFGWPLSEYRPPPGHTYREIVREHGFPGPYAHRFMYSRLKERAIRLFLADHPGRVMLVTGARAQESRRRMGTSQSVGVQGRLIWVAPIINWTSDDKHAYLANHHLPENPVVQVMCYSGECLCGAYARPGELAELKLWFPDAAAEIEALQREVAALGKHCRWGEPPPNEPEEPDPAQADLFSMCWSCARKVA